MCMIYLILTATLQIWSLTVRWKEPLEYSWSIGLHVFYCIQRFGKFILNTHNKIIFIHSPNLTDFSASAMYYYLYKRSALRISDPRFYENLQHVHRQTIN